MSKNHRPQGATPSFLSGEQRINKLLAAAGFGSRRQVDELITEGRVEIDGKIVTQVGIKVDADQSKILVDGEPLKRHKPVYYAVHKPEGVLCTNADPEGRPRVIELVPSTARLFPVGRLDASSTGLILLTNDGELAQRLAHPKHCVPKTYFVVVAGQVEHEAMRRLQRGIYLAEGIARVDGATIRKVRKGCTEIDITLSEGKNREIRRVLARLGHKVVVLRRTAIGPLKLADMPEGAYRSLDSREVASLYQAVEEIKKARNQDRRERKKRSEEFAENTAAKKGPKPKKAVSPVFDEEGDGWGDSDEFAGDSIEAGSILDSLPPMSNNPYRTADDEDDGDGGAFQDSVLVSDIHSDEVFSNTRGSVISYDDDFDSDGASRGKGPFVQGSGFEEGDDFDDSDEFPMSDEEGAGNEEGHRPARNPRFDRGRGEGRQGAGPYRNAGGPGRRSNDRRSGTSPYGNRGRSEGEEGRGPRSRGPGGRSPASRGPGGRPSSGRGFGGEGRQTEGRAEGRGFGSGRGFSGGRGRPPRREGAGGGEGTAGGERPTRGFARRGRTEDNASFGGGEGRPARFQRGGDGSTPYPRRRGSFGDRRSSGGEGGADRDRGYGKRSFGERTFSDSGEGTAPQGERRPARRPYGNRSSGDRPNEGRSGGGRSYGAPRGGRGGSGGASGGGRGRPGGGKPFGRKRRPS